MLEIGNLKLKSNLILSPMAGISDLAFRMLNRGFGAELAFVEMINCRSISYKSRRTHEMLKSSANDRPLGVQILGCEPRFILRAVDVLRKYKFDILDFNAACPAKKVVRRGEGSGLLREPKKLQNILRLIVKNHDGPVTVKIRAGWDKDSVNARDVALACEDAGVDALFIHGRTRQQEYSGSVDYRIIREVKKALKIPVIASGDILSAILAKKMFTDTGCNGIVVARGCLGNPWIFQEIGELLRRGRVIDRPQAKDIIKVMLVHLDACIGLYGERVGVVKYRKFFAWYTKGFRRIRPLREEASKAKTGVQMKQVIAGCLK